MLRLRVRSAVAAAAIFVVALPALGQASTTDQQRCLIAKHKAVGKHQACLLKGFAAAAAELPDPSACDAALQKAFGAAEERYGVSCHTSNDEALLQSRGSHLVSVLDGLLGPGSADPSQLGCIADKLKAASRLASCLEKAETTFIAKDLQLLDLSRCSAKLADGVAKAEAGGACPAGGDAASIETAGVAAFHEGEADLADLGTADFASPGRYEVVTRTLTFVDSSRPTRANGSYAGAPDRTLVVTISFPRLPDPMPVPMLIRAHGFSGFRFDSNDLTEHLASHGIMVVAPDFPLSNLNAPGGPTLLDLDEQVVDIGFLIDRMLALNATAGNFFEGKIDESRIGIIGHSLGGATVLGAAYHPTLADPRIKATVALAPLACIFQHEFYTGGSSPLMILSGTGDLVTIPASNHVAAYGFANPEKYLVSLDGGLHIGFSDDFLGDDGVNADDVLSCPALIPPGSPRPVTLDVSIPPDFLGGAAAGVDTTASACEPICPLPGPSWMAHNRQRDIELAASLAMFEWAFDGNVSADRMLTGRLDAENGDVAVSYER